VRRPRPNVERPYRGPRLFPAGGISSRPQAAGIVWIAATLS
jgi:hypothetical protein